MVINVIYNYALYNLNKCLILLTAGCNKRNNCDNKN